ncbi:MAG: dTMP kinase [Candidatus Beckwithbacteria bacterium]|nr:dTMP kinase [Candidatus Beckwithbacteria bacterium]
MSLIVFEGIDGSGKSTQVQMLFNYLKSKKVKVEKLDFPRYDCFFGKIIHFILHQKWGKEISPYWVAWLFATDRLLAKRMINNWLKAGKTVLIDRYTGSSQAHQGAKLKGKEREKIINWIERLEDQWYGLPKADEVFWLKMPAQVTSQLISGRKREKDEAEKDLEHQRQAFEIYQQLAKRKKWQIINSLDKNNQLLSAQKIHEEIISRLCSRL